MVWDALAASVPEFGVFDQVDERQRVADPFTGLGFFGFDYSFFHFTFFLPETLVSNIICI
jgi:hypothetical protein